MTSATTGNLRSLGAERWWAKRAPKGKRAKVPGTSTIFRGAEVTVGS